MLDLDKLERQAVEGNLDWRTAHALVSHARKLEYEIARLRSAQPNTGEVYAWESTTAAYMKYVTDERYHKFSAAVQKWYQPIRCMTGPVMPSELDLALTEQAARAAGFEVRRYRVRDLEVIHVREPGGSWRRYDPLNNDGEAFRLMVSLCLAGFVYGMESKAHGAPALRRVIVARAAAEASITMGED
ncbi:hypothetical protein [Cupriavidus sp. IDO]|uniref:hypothetical protein n=1 Tax=Cupriavidus sp. IDO TaxID=1539142 RepID=UPI000691E294|nr:hypothetical protein [Cupriavidus sp. IDO]KWR88794.1 hypothetical protein RM96_17930 [Cupriavidus sp. IDO]